MHSTVTEDAEVERCRCASWHETGYRLQFSNLCTDSRGPAHQRHIMPCCMSKNTMNVKLWNVTV